MTPPAVDPVLRVPIQALEGFCIDSLVKVGVGHADSRTCAAVLASTDVFGVITHGVKYLHGYVRRLKAGGLRVDASPINVDTLLSISAFKSIVDGLIRQIRNAPLARGADRTYLRGEMEWERRERALRQGIDLPEDVAASVAAFAVDLNLPFPC